jgi:hypothetical protein
VYWYFVPQSHNQLPFATCFADPIFDSQRFEPYVGMTRKWSPINIGNQWGFTGITPCGDADAFLAGISTTAAPCGCPTCMCVPFTEVPVGVIDGSNRNFQLSMVPLSNMAILFFIDGVAQTYLVDYTVSGQRITTNAGSTPRIGNSIMAWYIVETP